MNTKLFLLFICINIVISCNIETTAPSSKQITISGQVLNGSTPLENIEVVVRKYNSATSSYIEYSDMVTTDSQGNYSLTTYDITANSYSLLYTSDNCTNMNNLDFMNLFIDVSEDTTSLTMNVHLQQFMTINSPTSYEVDVAIQPTIDWDEFPNTSYYQITLSNNSTGIEIFRENVTTSSYTLTATLENNTMYGCLVMSYDSNDIMIGAKSVHFTTIE